MTLIATPIPPLPDWDTRRCTLQRRRGETNIYQDKMDTSSRSSSTTSSSDSNSCSVTECRKISSESTLALVLDDETTANNKVTKNESTESLTRSSKTVLLNDPAQVQLSDSPAADYDQLQQGSNRSDTTRARSNETFGSHRVPLDDVQTKFVRGDVEAAAGSSRLSPLTKIVSAQQASNDQPGYDRCCRKPVVAGNRLNEHCCASRSIEDSAILKLQPCHEMSFCCSPDNNATCIRPAANRDPIYRRWAPSSQLNNQSLTQQQQHHHLHGPSFSPTSPPNAQPSNDQVRERSSAIYREAGLRENDEFLTNNKASRPTSDQNNNNDVNNDGTSLPYLYDVIEERQRHHSRANKARRLQRQITEAECQRNADSIMATLGRGTGWTFKLLNEYLVAPPVTLVSTALDYATRAVKSVTSSSNNDVNNPRTKNKNKGRQEERRRRRSDKSKKAAKKLVSPPDILKIPCCAAHADRSVQEDIGRWRSRSPLQRNRRSD